MALLFFGNAARTGLNFLWHLLKTLMLGINLLQVIESKGKNTGSEDNPSLDDAIRVSVLVGIFFF